MTNQVRGANLIDAMDINDNAKMLRLFKAAPEMYDLFTKLLAVTDKIPNWRLYDSDLIEDDARALLACIDGD